MFRRHLFILALGVGLARGQQPAAGLPQVPSTPVVAGEVGSKLPDFAVLDLHGHPMSSSNLKGKVVLIDFWATWCGPCKKEMPGYQQLVNRYGPQGLVVIGFKFNTMKDEENPTAFARRLRITYPLVVATELIKQSFGGIEGLPTTLLYDRKGILRNKVIGFEYTNVIEDQIKQLL
jgi:thiol-disulfide isomerase/thioredoxin